MAEAVKVIVRCRPLNGREESLKCLNVIEMDSTIGQCRLIKANENSQPPKAFTFDGVFNTDSITESIYADICFPLVEGCVEGYNGTVFAYGQTGCGKSFTMQGITEPPTQRGIIPRAFEHIFESIQVSDNAKFLVHASFLEIYNEDIRDLLGKDHKAKLDVKEHPDFGVYVKDLKKSACHSVMDMEKLMAKGGQNRSVGSTLMNADSSRSHSIFTIYVETCETGDDGEEHIRAGKLNLVDLAGSERQAKTGASGDRLKEATKINLSLSALGNVISALVDGKSKHIPYRDSKLTRLLQDSLGGNTKTLMVACISPADNNYDETLSTLRYANRAKNIKNKPKINEDPKDALLREYQGEIATLKKMLMGELAMTPEILEKLGLTGVNIPTATTTNTTSTIHPAPSSSTKVDSAVMEAEAVKIKKEYEEKLVEMRQQFEEEKLTKQLLEKEVDLLQQNLRDAMHDATLNGFEDEHAEAILRDFQKKVDESEVITAEQPTQLSLSKEHPQRPDSPAKMLRGVAAKGLGLLKDKLSGSQHNLSVSVSKKGESFAEPDIHVTEATKKSTSGISVGNVASHIQEEAVRRLNTLQEQLVGGENMENIELKKRHKKRKEHARERRKKMEEDIKKWEGEGIMAKVYDNLQDEIKVKSGQVVKLENEVEAAKIEIDDLQAEFQSEREGYLEALRELERQVKLQEQILGKIQPTIRRDCNYYNLDRVKKQGKFDDETQMWLLPELQIEKTSLPGLVSRENLPATGSKMSNSVIHESRSKDVDFYANKHLHRSMGEDTTNNYFKSKRVDALLSSSGNSGSHVHDNTENTEPVRRPQKLEAIPVAAFEKKKRRNKKDMQ